MSTAGRLMLGCALSSLLFLLPSTASAWWVDEHFDPNAWGGPWPGTDCACWYTYGRPTNCTAWNRWCAWDRGYGWTGRGYIHEDWVACNAYAQNNVNLRYRDIWGAWRDHDRWFNQCTYTCFWTNVLAGETNNMELWNGNAIDCNQSQTGSGCGNVCGYGAQAVRTMHEYGDKWAYANDWIVFGGYGSGSIGDTSNRSFPWGEAGLYAYGAVDTRNGNVILPQLFSGRRPYRVHHGDGGTNLWNNYLNFAGGGNAAQNGNNGCENCDAYAFAWVYSPGGAGPRFNVGSDDGARVWYNGNLALDNNAYRGTTWDQDRVGGFGLPAGWSRILFKVHNGGGGFGGIFSFKNGGDDRQIEPSMSLVNGDRYAGFSWGYEQDDWYPMVTVTNFYGVANPVAIDGAFFGNNTTVTTTGTSAGRGPVPLWKTMEFRWGYGCGGVETNFADVNGNAGSASWTHTETGIIGHRRYHFFAVSRSGRASFQSSGPSGGWAWSGTYAKYMDVYIDNKPPLNPAFGTVTVASPTQINMTWTKPLDQGANVGDGSTEAYAKDGYADAGNYYRAGNVGMQVYRSQPAANTVISAYTRPAQSLDDNVLTPNTQYTYSIQARDNTGETRGTWHNETAIVDTQTRWTLAQKPIVGGNIATNDGKTIQVYYPKNSTFGFTNPAGFGPGTHGGNQNRVSKFKYVWDMNATHTWTGTETDWNSGDLSLSPIADGNHYLHLQSWSEDGVVNNATLPYGPFLYDGTIPQPTISGPTPSATNSSAPATFVVGFGEQVSNMSLAGLEITYTGTASATVTVTPQTNPAPSQYWNVTFSNCTGDGTAKIKVKAGAASDKAGNLSLASADSLLLTIDNTRPSPVITREGVSPTNSNSVIFRINFGESVDNFVLSDITLTTGAGISAGQLTNLTGGPAAVYLATVGNITGTGTVGIQLSADVANDPAGNLSQAAAYVEYYIDQGELTCSVARFNPAGANTNLDTVTYQITFNKKLLANSFLISDIQLGGSLGGEATPANLTQTQSSPSIFTVDVTNIVGTGTISLTLPANRVQDEAGNLNLQGCGPVSYNIDQGDFACVVTRGDPNPTNASEVSFHIVFDKPVTDFTISDITLGGTLGGTSLANFTGSGTTYDVDVINISGGGNNSSVSIIVAADVAHDQFGNKNNASSTVGYTIDQQAPTVLNINRQTPSAQITNAQQVVYRATFSEVVNNVDITDFTPMVVSGDISGASVVSVSAASGSTIDVTVDTGSSGSGDLRLAVDIPGATLADNVGNALIAGFGSGQVYTIDRAKPTVTTIVRHDPLGPTSATSVIYRVTFSRNVNGVDISDFQAIDLGNSLTGEAVTGVSATSGTVIDVTVAVGSGESGQLRLDVNASTATLTDDVGNLLTTSFNTGEVYIIDRTPLTATITRTSPNPNNASSVGYRIEFNKSVSDFASEDITIGGTIPNVIPGALIGSGTTYNINMTGISASGTLYMALAGGVVTDAAGNGNQATGDPTDWTYTIDQNALLCTILPLSTHPKNNLSTVRYQVGFNKQVTDFELLDITLGGTIQGAHLANFTQTQVEPSLFEVEVTDIATSGTGTISIELAAGVAHDAASNANGGCGPVEYTIDQGTPGVTSIMRYLPLTQVVNASSVVWRVNFSEGVTGVGPADFTPVKVSGTLADFSVVSVTMVGSDIAQVTVDTGTGSGELRLDVLVPGATIQDTAGNPLTGSFTAGQVYTIDRDNPTVLSSARHNPTASPTNVTTVTWRVTFSRSVNNVDIADFTLADLDDSMTGEQITSVSASSGTTFDVTCETGTGSAGNLRLDVNADTATIADDVGNPLSTHFFYGQWYAIDRSAFSATITRNSISPTNATGVSYHIVFNKTAIGFEVSDITLESNIPNVALGTLSGGNNIFDVTVTNINGSGWLGISLAADVAHDVAGNGNQPASRVDYTIDQEGLFCDLTRLSSNPTNANTVGYQIKFRNNKVVTDFDVTDLVLGGTVQGTTLAGFSGSGDTYTVNVTGISGTGTVTLELPAGVVHDAATNANNACGPLAYNIDQTPLTCVITRTSSNPTNAVTVNYDIVFNKDVADFTLADVTKGGTIGGTSLSNFIVASSKTYRVSVTNIAGTGTVDISVAAGVAHDSVGNPNQAAGPVAYDVNQDPLTVTVNQGSGQSDPTNVLPVIFDVVFNRPVSDFATGDVTFSGGAVVSGYDIQGSGTNYTIAVTTLSSEGQIVAGLAAGVAHDEYGNGNIVSSATDNLVLYSTGTAPQISSWVSVRNHTGVGPLSLPLNAARGDGDVDPGPTTESRRFGVQKLVIQFSKAVEVVGSLDSSFTIVGWPVGGSPSSYLAAVSNRTLNGSTLTVDFTSNSLPNKYRFKVTLNGNSFRDPETLLPLTGDLDCQFRCLLGNINSDPYVDMLDLGSLKTKNRALAGQADNARFDINTSGQIDVLDMALVSPHVNVSECP